MTKPTHKEIADRLKEMRGPVGSVVLARLTDTVFGDSEDVFVSRNDVELWSNSEFVFVIPSNVSSYESMLARGYWAETKHFELPIILTI